MEQISDIERRRAFSRWLRTGQLTSIRGPDGTELKFKPWHDPDTGRFTLANTRVHYGRESGRDVSGGGVRTGRRSRSTSSSDGDIVVTARKQTVEDVELLSDRKFDAFERTAKAQGWTSRRENAEIAEYSRLKRAVAARRRMEKAGERDWAQQGKDFTRLYAEEVLVQAAGKFVIAPAIRRAAPVVERLVRPQAYARKVAARTSLPPAPKPIWVDENATMKPRAQRYQDSAPGARSNVATKRGQAPALYRTTDDGKKRLVRFDGHEDGRYPVYIDKKTGVRSQKKFKDQAIRQSTALRQNHVSGRWDVPDQKTKIKAQKILRSLNIENIGVKVVPE